MPIASLCYAVSTAAATEIEIVVRAFIPDAAKTRPDYFSRTPQGTVIKDPFGGCYLSDGRKHSLEEAASSRISTRIRLRVSGRDLAITSEESDTVTVGPTHKVDCDTGQTSETRTAAIDAVIGPIKKSRFSRTMFVSVSGGNPFMTLSDVSLGPKIDFSYVVRYDIALRRIYIDGSHNTFPAYEAMYRIDDGDFVRFHRFLPTTETAYNLMDFWLGVNTTSFDAEVTLPRDGGGVTR